jgi:hypothetical protein
MLGRIKMKLRTTRNMKAIPRSIQILSAILLPFSVFSLGQVVHGAPDQEEKVAADEQWPYEFVETKTEPDGHKNVMDLYAFSGEINAEVLRKFCLQLKKKSNAKAFYYVVIFDDKKNAKFPSTPFTAEYGMDEVALKHIRAIYCYNKLNGFSEVRYHSANVWDHVPKREKL